MNCMIFEKRMIKSWLIVDMGTIDHPVSVLAIYAQHIVSVDIWHTFTPLLVPWYWILKHHLSQKFKQIGRDEFNHLYSNIEYI
jgi:hypothetical protein